MTGRLVLLHGWLMTGAVMAPLAAALAPGFDILTPDLPGHGAPGRPGLAAAAAGLAQLLADGRPTVLVGWSLGALVGWQHLAVAAGPLRGMVSLDMSPRPLAAPGWDYAMRGRADLGPDLVRAAPGLAAGILARGADPDRIDALARVIAARDPAAMQAWWQDFSAADLRAAVAALPVPLLAIHGGKSQVYDPACAWWLASAAPRGEAVILDSAGHAPHLEAPDQTAAWIRDFAERMIAP